VISDKHPQRTNCSRSGETSAVPGDEFHDGLGDSSLSPDLLDK
jgi:hypothetical protein